MLNLQSKLLSRRHLVWLLWLVMLLPVAQVAASWHVLSHVNSQPAPERDSRQAIHHAQCDLCLGAAALVSGALPVSGSAEIGTPALHEAALSTASIVQWRLVTPAYLSRAPPSFLC
jgi:hypothetical protein